MLTGQLSTWGQGSSTPHFARWPPIEGDWRLVHPAEMVWRAYHEDKLHWYIPDDLRDFHAQVVAEPEVVREERAALLAAMMP